MSHDSYPLIGLAISLLGVLVASTWRFSALASKLLSATEQSKRDAEKAEEKLEALEKVPILEQRIGQLERNHSLIPRLESRVIVVEEAVKFSKELRMRRSRPDPERQDD